MINLFITFIIFLVEEETALQYILTTPKLWILAAGIYKEDRSKYPLIFHEEQELK